MKQFISSRSLVLFCLVAIRISCCLSPCEAQTFTLAPDSTITGPFQSVRVNVVDNDIVPCTNYTLSVTSFNGTGIAKDTLGNYIVYHPAKYDTPPTVGDTTVVSINYLVTCGTTSKTSTLKVKVTKYNDPANLIPSNVTCFSYMPSNVTFGIKRKYTTSLNGTSEPARDNAIDAYQAPLVGDLNGDGKPEIVATGIYGTDNGSSHRINHVNIFDGQDGTRKIRFTLSNLGADYGPFYVGKPYHRAPSIMAIADLIPGNDNISEIVVCNAYPGRVFALKPVFNGTNITTLTKEWDGKDHNGNIVRFNEPLTGNKDWVGAEGKFQYPHPYIADINGDGIPEVIVYNKIYNGATGKLLMSWRDAATSQTGKVSSVDGAGSLSDQSFDSPMTQENAAKIRNVAMTGRRPGNGRYADKDLAVPAIVDIDGDGQQEIITGNRIHKFQFNSLTDHTQNTYTTIEGPLSVDLPVTPGSSNKTKFYLSDGHTRVADIDGDGVLDIIVVS